MIWLQGFQKLLKKLSLDVEEYTMLPAMFPDFCIEAKTKNGLNNLRKLQASKSNWRKFEPFEGLLNINDMDYTIGNSPLGEAMDDFCGNWKKIINRKF